MGEELAHSFPLEKHLYLPEVGYLLIAEYHDEVNRAISNLIDKIN